MSYSLPTMGDIRSVVGSSGLRVVSTFSGCGGSCLGFEMAGFEIVYATEFIEAARRTYEANHHGVFVDGRDIRNVTAEDILSRTGLASGELDVFEGSPPCSPFSMIGKRESGWGEVKSYSESAQRSDDLFFEWARLLGELRPKAFVAENVPGLVAGKAFGYFKTLVEKLRSFGYLVEARKLEASWLGVASRRERLILVGVRADLAERIGMTSPPFPGPLSRRTTLRDAFEGFVDGDTRAVERKMGTRLRANWHATPRGQSSQVYFQHIRCGWDDPTPAIVAQSKTVNHPEVPRSLSIGEAKRVSTFPDDFVLNDSFRRDWERIGRAVPPRMMAHVARALREEFFRPLGLVREGAREAIGGPR